jgi:hypothetical protein
LTCNACKSIGSRRASPLPPKIRGALAKPNRRFLSEIRVEVPPIIHRFALFTLFERGMLPNVSVSSLSPLSKKALVSYKKGLIYFLYFFLPDFETSVFFVSKPSFLFL